MMTMKWLMDFFLPRLLLGMLIFCLMIVTGLIQPSHSAAVSDNMISSVYNPVLMGLPGQINH